jgi:hypothetical protein
MAVVTPCPPDATVSVGMMVYAAVPTPVEVYPVGVVATETGV